METLAFFPPAKRTVGTPVTKGGHGICSESGVSYPNHTQSRSRAPRLAHVLFLPGGVEGGEGSAMGGGDTKSQDTAITSPPFHPPPSNQSGGVSSRNNNFGNSWKCMILVRE